MRWNLLESSLTAFIANACFRAREPDRPEIPGGRRLFEYACRLTCDGIRHQNPGIDEAQVQQILRERLACASRLEQRS